MPLLMLPKITSEYVVKSALPKVELLRFTWTGSNGNDYVDYSNESWGWKFYGYDGYDEILGGKGSDYLYGGDGNDVLSGKEGNDRLYGENGNDRLFGGGGNDEIYGGNGDDFLSGDYNQSLSYSNGYQIDQLWGGAGADVFSLREVFSPVSYTQGGYAVINDFSRAEGDRIQVAASRNDRYELEYANVAGIGTNAVDTQIYYSNSFGVRQMIGVIADVADISIAADFNVKTF